MNNLEKKDLIELRIRSRWVTRGGYHEWSARLYINRKWVASMPTETHIGRGGCQSWAMGVIQQCDKSLLRNKWWQLEQCLDFWTVEYLEEKCTARDLKVWSENE